MDDDSQLIYSRPSLVPRPPPIAPAFVTTTTIGEEARGLAEYVYYERRPDTHTSGSCPRYCSRITASRSRP